MSIALNGAISGDGGCPVWPSVEVMETIRTDDNCTNRWNYERHVANNKPAINTRKERLESKVFLGKTGEVPPMTFNCPCEPGTKTPRFTEAGYSQDFGFQWWKLEEELDACEIVNYCDVSYIAEQTSIPYEDQPANVKWLAWQNKLNMGMNESALNRYEVMASSIRYFGAYVVQRDKEDDMLIDFGKSPCTTVTLKRSLSNTDTWPTAIHKGLVKHFMAMNKGMRPTEMTVGMDAFTALEQHHLYRKINLNCECSEPGNQFLEATDSNCGISFVGTWEGIPMWMDARTTTCPITGRTEFQFPQDAVLFSNESDGGQDIRIAHTTNYLPELNWPVGDFFYDNGTQKQKNNVTWWATLEGSVMMVPTNVNRTMMVRNVGDSISAGPDCGVCTDILVNTDGMIASPQGLCCNPEEAEIEGADAAFFEVCTMLMGMTADVTHCSEGDDGKCFPGKVHQVAPWNTCCPGDAKRIVTKEFLIEQGFTEDCFENLIRMGAIVGTEDEPNDEDCAVTPVAARGKVVSAKAGKEEAKRLSLDAKKMDS